MSDEHPRLDAALQLSGDASDPAIARGDIRREPLWQLLLLAICTGGFYLAAWVYRVTGDRDASKSARPRRIAWTLGSLTPPVLAALLFDFSRNEEPGSQLSRRTDRSAAVPAIALLALHFLVAMSELGSLWITGWILLPIPVLLVQRRFNQNVNAETVGFGWPRFITLLFAVPLAAAVMWWIDAPMASRASPFAIAEGAPIRGRSEAYVILSPSTSWREVSPGTLGDTDSDLELTTTDGSAWVVAYVHEDSSLTLDQVVDERLAAIDNDNGVEDFSESREFIPHPEFATMSLADYRVSITPFERGHYLVLTTRLKKRTIEVIGYVSDTSPHQAELERLMDDFRIPRNAEP